ncbi:phenylalanine--tRNA ligase subunit beta [Micromonospora sp. DT43]|uniref:phenylalanine--tRNA ligase subunit beta n=1 Tax=Micromonospora sp. DT43 TaxID=3393440 RepID=UPI003CEA914B
MKISVNWLSDYVDLDDMSSGQLAERLTLATAESEGVETVTNVADAAVVARIVDVQALSTGEGARRALVTLDTGVGEAVRTVSTAPNVRLGLRVAYAPPGAALPGGVVGVADFDGVVSTGMLCSAAELGIGSSHEVVLECPDDAALGKPLSTWIPTRDALIDFDNKSLTHRPDLWGHYGFAREVAAILERPLRPLAVADLSRFDDLPAFPATDDALDDCPCFSCLAVDIAANVPSPLTMQGRLHLLGQRTFNVLVDTTNYLMLELGQPTHVYDRRKVSEIRVAHAGEVSSFRTLDGQERQLQSDDLLIYGGDGPIGLAGIMGGQDSGVRADTTQILLESANFRAARVRRTSVRLGLRTDASQRYEKSQPPSNSPVGLARLLRLLEDAGTAPTPVSRASVLGDPADAPRIITMPATYIQERAGAELPQERITQILTGLGFGAEVRQDELTVSVPAFRAAQDISLPADILEEVLRVHGYASIEPVVPSGGLAATKLNGPVRREHKARRLLAQAYGFTEVENYPWLDDDWNAELKYVPGESLRLRNPVAPERSRLRKSLLPNLLRDVAENVANVDDFRLFEIGRVYLPGTYPPDAHSSDPSSHLEEVRLAGASVRPARSGSVEEHFRQVKGALEDLGAMLAETPVRTGAGHEEAGDPWQVPDLWADIQIGDTTVGSVGVLMGPILDTVAPQRQVIWFELALSLLDAPVYPEPHYESLPSVPGSRQDFSLVWAGDYEELVATLDEFSHPLVQQREFVTVYRGKGLPPGTASYTFRFWLQAPDHTLTGAELEGFRDEFLTFVKERGITLR